MPPKSTKPSWYHSRHYLHFDPTIGYKRAQKIVTCPDKVAKHAFYPLIAYHVNSKKLKHDKSSGNLEKKKKSRPIAYAAHLDSHIYSYYAHGLANRYEKIIKRSGVDSSVLAFRPLGKSNIDFAAEAFREIRDRRACTAVAMDVSGFFDNLNHSKLREAWCTVIGEARLPNDHFSIYKSLTRFSTVDKDELYKSLGISSHNPKKGRRTRLCLPVEFREKVRETGLIKKNTDRHGIPQGTSISALLSNIYMFKFDISACEEATRLGGKYYRYCDDMLFILPTEHKESIISFVEKSVANLELKINPDKTEVRDFEITSSGIRSNKPLQYLGFTFDGKHILIRSAALARYSERMKRGVRLTKATMNKRNELKSKRRENPKPIFRRNIYERYSHLGRRNFIRYGLRSADILESKAIKKQLKPLWERLKNEIEKE